MQYNRTLDYTLLALDSLVNGKPVLAARLLAKAAEQTDVQAAIKILEHSNKTAHTAMVQASAAKRLKASPEFEEEGDSCEADAEDGDPLDEVEDMEPEPEVNVDVEEEPVAEVPAKTMAAVLNRMVRKDLKK